MMKAPRFYLVFVRSLSDVSYYHELRTRGFSFSLRYLSFLLLCIWTVNAAAFSFALIGTHAMIGAPQLESLNNEIVSRYPSDLVLRLDDGVLSSNTSPVRIPFKAKAEGAMFGNAYSYWLTIDTSGAAVDYAASHSVFILTDRSLLVPSGVSDPRYQTIALKDVFNNSTRPITLTANSFASLVHTAFSYSGYVRAFLMIALIPVILLLPFLGAVLQLMALLVYLLSAAAIMTMISRFMKKSVRYREMYRLCMHGITASLLYQTLSWMTGFSIPFGGTIILVIWMTLVLRDFPVIATQNAIATKPVKKNPASRKTSTKKPK